MTCSLASAGNQIRQRAFDGSAETVFRSVENARVGDHLTLTFDVPVPVRGIAVTTGGVDGADLLDNGSIEISANGVDFTAVGSCNAQGLATNPFPEKPLRAIRLKVGRDLGHPLVVREFAITSDRVRPFQHPVEFTVICTDAPELREWTEETARLCEQWYDSLNDFLTAKDTHPTDRITLTMTRRYRGVAAASMEQGTIRCAVNWFEKHRDDQGAVIHETLHIIQRYPGYGTPRAPSWLVEGIDDYVRFFFYEPGKAGPVPKRAAQYDASYRITATFLDYLMRIYDKEIIHKLDAALRAGIYKPALFEEATGKSVHALNDEWRASMGIPVVPVAISLEKGAIVGDLRGGKEGTSFQDEAQGRMAQVKVRGGWWIDSVTSTWNDGKVDKASTTHGGSGGDEQIIDLQPGESLIQIAGVIREDGDRQIQLDQVVIGSLTFKTNRRTIGPIGTSTQGAKFTLDAPKGQEICGFHGRSGPFLNAIGIVCRPIP